MIFDFFDFDVCDFSGWCYESYRGVYFCSCGFYFVTLWCWFLFLRRYKKLFVFVLLKMFVFCRRKNTNGFNLVFLLDHHPIVRYDDDFFNLYHNRYGNFSQKFIILKINNLILLIKK